MYASGLTFICMNECNENSFFIDAICYIRMKTDETKYAEAMETHQAARVAPLASKTAAELVHATDNEKKLEPLVQVPMKKSISDNQATDTEKQPLVQIPKQISMSDDQDLRRVLWQGKQPGSTRCPLLFCFNCGTVHHVFTPTSLRTTTKVPKCSLRCIPNAVCGSETWTHHLPASRIVEISTYQASV
jgi:hypothetical protein